ncbi:O-antigen ligase family protein [Roseiarcaceae bacterium H3SJ34-1]|uniref:O-antigen ligase family protein n=1 Tax=Terripilifer ovatus TaxID=3032367 RepID=UPI003AB92220|nr:O-antigen ligase family protein [Roseiarcaceae bacterium H3SJ34-1]
MKIILFWLCGAVIAAALLFGGGARQGLVSDAVPETLSLLLLAFALPRAMPLLRNKPWSLALLIGVLLLPLLQTIPLPPFIWRALPGRQAVADIYAVAGVDVSWRPLSLIPGASWRAFLFLFPAIAVFLSVLSFDRQARQWLLLLMLAIGIVCVPLAMLQVVGGEGSPLYFYEITNFGKGVGFFANANHFAAFQYAMLPLAACAIVDMRERFVLPPLVIFGGVAAILLTGLALTGSRSALLLGVLSMILTAVFVLRPEISKIGRRRGLWLVAAFVFVFVPFASGMGLLAILERFDRRDLAEDARWVVAANTWNAVRIYFPFGSGFGTFPDVYQLHERLRDVIPPFVNRAHDDLLEVLLEGGIFSLCLLASLIAWLCVHTAKAFARDLTPEARQARAGIIVLWLFLLHSCWDYPMRTIALSTVAAACMALQFSAQSGSGVQSSSSRSRRRKHSTSK